jgi:hypothetical protein
VWAHLLPAAKRPPTLPALEQLLLVPDAHDAGGSLDACQQQVRRLLQMSCGDTWLIAHFIQNMPGICSLAQMHSLTAQWQLV